MESLTNRLKTISEKYIINQHGIDHKCLAASVVRLGDVNIYCFIFNTSDNNINKIIVEINNEVREYLVNSGLSIASACALPALSVIIKNLSHKNCNSDKIILSGDSVLSAFLNYALKYNGANTILCAGTDKANLLHLVAITDINLFYNAATQNEDEIINEEYDLNIITDEQFKELIKKDISKYVLKIDYFSSDITDAIPDLALWIGERKIADDTFFTVIKDVTKISEIDNNGNVTAILDLSGNKY